MASVDVIRIADCTVDSLQAALDHGLASVLEEDEQGATLLWHACATGNAAVIPLLLERGSALNFQKQPEGSTPLYIAAQNGFLTCCELLVSAGADVDLARDTGATPLFIATQAGSVSVVKFMLRAGASPRQQNNQRCTPFVLACSMGHTEIAVALLEARADFSDKETGMTPLQWCKLNKHTETRRAVGRIVAESFFHRSVFAAWRRWVFFQRERHNRAAAEAEAALQRLRREQDEALNGPLQSFEDLCRNDVVLYPFDIADIHSASLTSRCTDLPAAVRGSLRATDDESARWPEWRRENREGVQPQVVVSGALPVAGFPRGQHSTTAPPGIQPAAAVLPPPRGNEGSAPARQPLLPPAAATPRNTASGRPYGEPALFLGALHKGGTEIGPPQAIVSRLRHSSGLLSFVPKEDQFELTNLYVSSTASVPRFTPKRQPAAALSAAMTEWKQQQRYSSGIGGTASSPKPFGAPHSAATLRPLSSRPTPTTAASPAEHQRKLQQLLKSKPLYDDM